MWFFKGHSLFLKYCINFKHTIQIKNSNKKTILFTMYNVRLSVIGSMWWFFDILICLEFAKLSNSKFQKVPNPKNVFLNFLNF